LCDLTDCLRGGASLSEFEKPMMHNFEKDAQSPGENTWLKTKHSEYLFAERGVAGRAWLMRAIAPSKPPHVCPRQGRRRLLPRFCAAGAGGAATV
jgi:hypothetical protein